MKKLKNLVPMLSLLLYGHLATAQQQNGIGHVTLLKKNEQAKTTNTSGIGHVTLLKKNALLIYLGAGSEGTDGSLKDNVSLSNMTAIDLGLYQPIWQRPAYSIGISASGHYLSSNKEPLENTPQGYHAMGETATTISARGSGSPKQQGFKTSLGPQMNIYLGNRFIASPILQAGYMSITQKAFGAEQTTDFGGTVYNYDLLRQTETKISGLAIMPKIRLHYMLADWIGLWAEASYTAGPKIKNMVSRFSPDGPPNQDGLYNIDQLMAGTNTTTVGTTKYSAIGLSGGIVIGLGNGKNCITCGGTSTTPPTSVPTGGTTPKGKVGVGDAEGIPSTPSSSENRKNGTGQARWWNHNNDIGHCGGSGVYCFRRKSFDKTEQIEDDVTNNEITVKMKGDVIIVNSIGTSGSIAENTMDAFKQNKVKLEGNYISKDVINEWLAAVNLPAVQNGVPITIQQQSYSVNPTTFMGNKVDIIEAVEKTKINIEGKEYNLTIITTSGRGTGSPKAQGF